MLGASRGIPLPSIEKCWSIGIYEGNDPLALRPSAGLDNPVLTAAHITDVAAFFVADPFMLRDGTDWHMFFEVYRRDIRRGEIGMASSTDGRRWTYRQIVLREPFHLSFPFVFAWGGAQYMIPETRGQQEVRLYRATAYPTTWTFERTLLTGAGFTDSSIVYFQRIWWLFTSFPGDSTLAVFHADRPDGVWTPHARNPLLLNARDRSRSAGRIIVSGDRLFRLAQDNSGSYGMRVNAFEITALTPTAYEERPAGPTPLLHGTRHGWNARGMHHMDAHEVTPGQWLACVDGFRKSLMVGYRRWPETSTER